ncbi:cupin domain-containing protein [Cupriavidus metallidurans]|uniref:cupin domain-containing protein n=1 Tax=Cupriavidus metallidurans TaxID=119219 RepID=UPI001CCEA536|nr:cupin domain-containing protein [Cupriavidus metallidurans]UBM09371.1 cupin domain-containing protein [Cupriavidus metallidurans]
MNTPMQRVVTGHNVDGKAIVTHEGAPPTIFPLESIPGTVFYELWSTSGTPAIIDNGIDPTLQPLCLPPPVGGTRVRIVDIPPDTKEYLRDGSKVMKAAFGEIGDISASTVAADSPHPLMHRTESVDYGFVLFGEIVLVLDTEERLLRQGDVVIQRGTNHAWANRSDVTCRMAFVLIDGKYAEEIQPRHTT